MPLLGYTPRFNGNPATANQYNTITTQFNSGLAAMLDDLEANNAEITVFRLDVAELFNEALTMPAAFGLTNVTSAAAPGLTPGTPFYDRGRIADEPNEYLFWDDVHPTAAVHAILADRALALLLSLPGDYNNDDVVDAAADYTVWRDNLGTNFDLNGNGDETGASEGVVDGADYDLWVEHFGESASGGAANAAAGNAAINAVPEPASLWLMLACCLFAACRNPRRKHRRWQ